MVYNYDLAFQTAPYPMPQNFKEFMLFHAGTYIGLYHFIRRHHFHPQLYFLSKTDQVSSKEQKQSLSPKENSQPFQRLSNSWTRPPELHQISNQNHPRQTPHKKNTFQNEIFIDLYFWLIVITGPGHDKGVGSPGLHQPKSCLPCSPTNPSFVQLQNATAN